MTLCQNDTNNKYQINLPFGNATDYVATEDTDKIYEINAISRPGCAGRLSGVNRLSRKEERE